MRIMLSVAVLATGCLSNPAKQVADSGDPLRLTIQSGTGSRAVEVEDGRSVHRYSDGSESETVRFKTVQQQFNWKRWSFHQGAARLDEQDWFRLRDPAASDEIAAARAKAERAQRWGLPLMLVGIAGVAATRIADMDYGAMSTRLVYLASSIVAAGGAYLYVQGVRVLRDPTLQPLERAYQAADVVEHCRGEQCVPLKGRVGLRMR